MGHSQQDIEHVTVAMKPVSMGADVKAVPEASEIERIASPDDPTKDHQDYGRIDAEVARYTTGARIDISEAESNRLRKMIDKRVLTIMV